MAPPAAWTGGAGKGNYNMALKFNIPLCELAWFEDSPDAGDPECICSYCGFVIPEDYAPVRFFGEGGKYEIRLHPACLELLTKGNQNGEDQNQQIKI